MEPLTRIQRADRAIDLGVELGKYADEHDASNEDELALKAVAASEACREYAAALSSE